MSHCSMQCACLLQLKPGCLMPCVHKVKQRHMQLLHIRSAHGIWCALSTWRWYPCRNIALYGAALRRVSQDESRFSESCMMHSKRAWLYGRKSTGWASWSHSWTATARTLPQLQSFPGRSLLFVLAFAVTAQIQFTNAQSVVHDTPGFLLFYIFIDLLYLRIDCSFTIFSFLLICSLLRGP